MPADPTDQILTVLSALPLTRRVPSLLNATDKTQPEWPVRVDKHDPEVMSHVLMVVSAEQLARRFFVGWNATPSTYLPKF